MTATSEADGGWTVNAARDSRWPRLQLSQPWVHRELIFFFALRDVKVRYKQAYLGAAWAALQPIAGAVAFTLLFNELAGVEVEDESYFVFALVGFIVWAYFTTAVNNGTNILLYNSELLTKVALPRIAFPSPRSFPGSSNSPWAPSSPSPRRSSGVAVRTSLPLSWRSLSAPRC